MESEFHLPPTREIGLSRSPSTTHRVIVCRGRSCRKYDGEEVFNNFKQNLPPNVELISIPCLGECGSGPMVLIESEKIWYSELHPDEVLTIIKQHLIGKSPVKEMLYPKFHPEH